MSLLSNHETWQHHTVRKKIKKIDLLTVPTDPYIVLWRPAPGRQFVVTELFSKVRNTAGTQSDEPNVLFDNGSNGSNIVADVTVVSTANNVQKYTLSATKVIDYDHPLRVKITDAPAGLTEIDIDVIVFARKLSD